MKRAWTALDLEERILNGAAIIALISVTLPWLSGEWLGGDAVTYTGFGFYTSFIGIAVFAILAFLLLITLVPLLGGPAIVRRKQRDIVRLCLASQVTVLLLAALSVLMKVTYEYSRIEIRFGIYTALIGSIVVSIYAFLRWQEDRKTDSHELFHHPEGHSIESERQEFHHIPPPPPPPPPLEPEEHHLHR
ncbi:hypothetical protein K8942_03235 [Candidatus Peribacteria bacterium]|nr:MAG: hypothetical protein K8942_03235 [Candidatus Peribacteria bacterium]